MKIRENKYATILIGAERYTEEVRINAKHCPVGPSDTAVRILEAMLHSEIMSEVDPQKLDTYNKGLPTIACDMAQYLWDNFEQRGWLINCQPLEVKDEQAVEGP